MSELSLQEAYVLDPTHFIVLYTHCVCVGGLFLTFSIKPWVFQGFHRVSLTSWVFHHVSCSSKVIQWFHQTHVTCYPLLNFSKLSIDWSPWQRMGHQFHQSSWTIIDPNKPRVFITFYKFHWKIIKNMKKRQKMPFLGGPGKWSKMTVFVFGRFWPKKSKKCS